jgi:hypothetical protein
MNLEVVKRQQPCRWFADPSSTKCRSCLLLHHVRPEGTDRTYCGHACDEGCGWYPLADTHPEDIEQMDRCTVCYSRLPERELVL